MTQPLLLIAAALAAASILASGCAAAQTFGGGKPRDAVRGEAAARPSMPPETVLAQRGDLKVTRADYDVELLRLPPDIRGGFATSEKRVADLLTRMLLTKELAALADSTGKMSDPVTAARLASEVERFKAQLMILQYEMDAAARFDADRSKWEARARDIYRAEEKRFEAPEMRTLSRLTIRVAPRGGAEAAMQAAQGLRGRWAAGEDYSKLALESDDGKSAAREPPQRVSRTDLPAGVVEAVFALPQGGVSEPLLVADEIHVYRVVERIPAGRKTFDQAKPEILRELKQRYVDSERSAVLGGYSDAARSGVKTELIDQIVLRVGAADVDRMHRDALKRGRASPAK